MGAQWFALILPLAIAGALWLVLANPGRRSCSGWTIGDGLRCWRDWLACRFRGGKDC